jgi:hypothetical protein
MKCEKIQKEVFLNNTVDEKVAGHLLECADCRATAESLECFISAKPDLEIYKIPKRIDDYITSESRAFIDERKTESVLLETKQHVRSFYKWASVFAYAACFILISWIVIVALADLNRTSIQEINNKPVAKLSVLDQEIKKWENVDMGDDFFILNTEIEINFASLFFSDDESEEETNDREEKEFSIDIPDFMT